MNSIAIIKQGESNNSTELREKSFVSRFADSCIGNMSIADRALDIAAIATVVKDAGR